MDTIQLAQKIIQLGIQERGPLFDWAEQCERAQWYALWASTGVQSPIGYDTARLAYQASQIASMDMSKAPAGSVSFYDKSAAGHVVTNIGNGLCINTSPLMDGKSLVDFGKNIRITRLADYFPKSYLGWSLRDGVRPRIVVEPFALPTNPPKPNPGSHATVITSPLSGAGWNFAPPAATVQKRIQDALRKRGRYTGTIDGVWGNLSVKGIQTTIHNVGYSGPIDGAPGKNTCHFVQVYAQKFGGYKGPIDNILGPNGWEGFARGLEAGLK